MAWLHVLACTGSKVPEVGSEPVVAAAVENIPPDGEVAMKEENIPEAVVLMLLHRHEQGLRILKLPSESIDFMGLGLRICYQGQQQ